MSRSDVRGLDERALHIPHRDKLHTPYPQMRRPEGETPRDVAKNREKTLCGRSTRGNRTIEKAKDFPQATCDTCRAIFCVPCHGSGVRHADLGSFACLDCDGTGRAKRAGIERRTFESLSAEVQAALVTFAAENGRAWRAELRTLWRQGRDGGPLRLARNVIAPGDLAYLTLPNES